MRGVVVDTSCWPVVWVRFCSDATTEDFQLALARLSTVVARSTPHVLVFDVRASPLHRPAHVSMQVSWVRQNLVHLRSHVIGVCFLIESPMLHFALSSVVSMVPMPVALSVVSTPEEAARWSSDSLIKHGFRSPDLTRLSG